MGIADAIPGISGGTVAFLTGIYPRLLAAIRRFDLRFLLPLFAGIGSGLLLFSHIAYRLLHHELGRPYLFSFFSGLIIASALMCARRIPRWGWRQWLALILGAVAAFFVTGLKAPQGHLYDVQLPQERVGQGWERATNYQLLGSVLLDVPERKVAHMLKSGVIGGDSLIFRQSDGRWAKAGSLELEKGRFEWKWPLFGLLGGCAMLLPGLSGAYILTILGGYEAAIGALAQLPSREAFELLAALGVGALAGILLCARLIATLFARYEAASTALLIGLMIGALRALWPFMSFHWLLDIDRGLVLTPLSPERPMPSTLLFWGVLLFVAMGALTLRLVEEVAKKKHDTVSAQRS